MTIERKPAVEGILKTCPGCRQIQCCCDPCDPYAVLGKYSGTQTGHAARAKEDLGGYLCQPHGLPACECPTCASH